MLSQFNLWAEYAGMALDAVLMLRILTLKLRRTYVYLTLYVLLNLFYDALALRMGIESDEFRVVSEFSRFIYAIVFPLIAWDLFEEAKELVDKVRKLAMSRMLGSLLFISIWSLLVAAFMGDGNGTHYMALLASIIWTGSVASAIAFLWVMRRGMRAHQWELPRNTTVWYWFVLFMLVIEAISCFVGLSLAAFQGAPKTVDLIEHVTEAVLQCSGILVTCWCVYQLRAISSHPTDEPVKVKG